MFMPTQPKMQSNQKKKKKKEKKIGKKLHLPLFANVQTDSNLVKCM